MEINYHCPSKAGVKVFEQKLCEIKFRSIMQMDFGFIPYFCCLSQTQYIHTEI